MRPIKISMRSFFFLNYLNIEISISFHKPSFSLPTVIMQCITLDKSKRWKGHFLGMSNATMTMSLNIYFAIQHILLVHVVGDGDPCINLVHNARKSVDNLVQFPGRPTYPGRFLHGHFVPSGRLQKDPSAWAKSSLSIDHCWGTQLPPFLSPKCWACLSVHLCRQVTLPRWSLIIPRLFNPGRFPQIHFL